MTLPDSSSLPSASKDTLIATVLSRLTALEAENAALRAENAQLRGENAGPPKPFVTNKNGDQRRISSTAFAEKCRHVPRRFSSRIRPLAPSRIPAKKFDFSSQCYRQSWHSCPSSGAASPLRAPGRRRAAQFRAFGRKELECAPVPPKRGETDNKNREPPYRLRTSLIASAISGSVICGRSALICVSTASRR